MSTTSSRFSFSDFFKNSWQRYRRLPRNVLALSFVSLLNDSSSEIIYPLLPFFLLTTLGASPAAIGIIEGAAESVSSFLKLFAGYLSDRFAKRKIVVFAGYGISSVLRPLLGLASSWTQVLFLRVTDRLGKGIRSAPRDAMIADATPPEKRGFAFGFHRAMDHVGAVLGPLLGFLLIQLLASDSKNPTASEYAQVFFLASIPALLALIVIGVFVKESPSSFVISHLPPDSDVGAQKNEDATAEKQRTKDKGQRTNPKFSGNFKRFLIILGFFTLSNSSDMFLLQRAGEMGVATTTIPLLWTFLHIVKVVTSLIGGDLSDRIGRKYLISSGWILYAGVYAGFALATSAEAAWILFLLYGIYFGLTEGAEKALVADMVPSVRRGTAFGWYHLAYGIAVFPASLMMGLLWQFYGYQTAFLVSAVISLVSSAAILSIKTQARESNGY